MHIVESIARVVHRVGEVVILLVVLLVVMDVLARAFGHPVRGAYEMYSYGTGVGVVLVFAYAQLMGRHIRIEMVTSRLSPRVQEVLSVIGYFICLAALTIVVYGSVIYGFMLKERGERTPVLEILDFPFPMVFAFGMAVFWLVFMSQLITNLMRKVRK